MPSFITFAILASGFLLYTRVAGIHEHHHNLHGKRQLSASTPELSSNASCGCTTYWTTWYGEASLVQDQPTTTSASTPEITSNASCGCTTYWTTWYGEASLVQDQPNTTTTTTSSSTSTVYSAVTTQSSSSTSSAVAVTTSTWSSATSTAVSTSSSESWAAPSTSVSSTSSSAAPSASSSGTSGSIAPNGNQWAMTYTPYNSDGSCKSADAVSSDIASIKAKGFTTVRIYATDCSGPQNIGAACKDNGLKLIVGIYIGNSGVGSNTDSQVSTLIQWGESQWDLVEMVVAGNEAVFNNYVSASELADFVGDVKSKFQAAGYSGPVTTTEPLGTIQQNAATICAAVDVVTANIHPFFNADVSASNAGGFVASQLGDLAQCCNNQKEAYNLETGWPSQGDANGAAVPSPENQKTAIESIIASAGSKSAMFSFENDGWKAPGSLDVEQYWGCADLFSG